MSERVDLEDVERRATVGGLVPPDPTIAAMIAELADARAMTAHGWCPCGHEHGPNDPHGACTSGKSCAASREPERVDVAELRRMAEDVTPGPWEILDAKDGTQGIFQAPIFNRSGGEEMICENFEHGANASLIVAAVNALPALLAELREARALIAFAEYALGHRGDGGSCYCAVCHKRDALKAARERK